MAPGAFLRNQAAINGLRASEKSSKKRSAEGTGDSFTVPGPARVAAAAAPAAAGVEVGKEWPAPEGG